jgi:TRAP-type C4-dicarboxylate transport system permease small subunit
VDIVLQAVPPELAWYMEWVGDVIGLVCCVVIAWFGTQAAWTSYLSGAVNIKTLVTPEWWLLAPLPLVFVLLAIEMVFRMIRLQRAERMPRNDAVSSA